LAAIENPISAEIPYRSKYSETDQFC